MKNYNGKSLIDIAEEILLENKAHTNMYELFDGACERKGISKEAKDKLIAQFYTDMISSARFVYLGDNEWDLKENQEITLWEKDGSYYKEYNKVDVPVDEDEESLEVKKASKASKAAKEAAKVAKKAAKEAAEAKEALAAEALAAIEEAKVEEKKVPEIETPIIPIEDVIPEQSLEFEEELFEEVEDDFDEEKYNEYMDTYEDQYED